MCLLELESAYDSRREIVGDRVGEIMMINKQLQR